jgi:class 3 adenylate cyclase
MDSDFQVFLINLLLSLKQTAPLDENLRAFMAPTLSKIKRYSGASIAAHIFVNPAVNEIHAMVLGHKTKSRQAISAELRFRHMYLHQGEQNEAIHRGDLPSYPRMELLPGDEIDSILGPKGEVRLVELSGRIALLLEHLSVLHSEEFAGLSPVEGEKIILIPLGTGDYGRLGCFVLWGPGDTLAKTFQNSRKQEGLAAFRMAVEQMLIRLFTNFYQIGSQTYLPSYFRVERKHVALLCAEIRGFDRISEILRYRHDFGREKAAECLRILVNRFSECTAQIIEKYKGRVDQIWGNGLLAVFGQYLDTEDTSSSVPCIRAAMAAADIVERARDVLKSWLWDDFKFPEYLALHSEHTELDPIVAVDYGDVVFDYVGSTKNRVYMSVGDHVNFVKQLAVAVGRTESGDSDLDPLVRQLKALINKTNNNAGAQLLNPPILLSQSAFTGAFQVLQFTENDAADWKHKHRTIRLPGKPTLYSVYEIGPENVSRQASSQVHYAKIRYA